MGSVFEDMCRFYTLEHGILGEFDSFITEVGTWWGVEQMTGTNGEKYQQAADIDVVGISTIDKTAVIGECKFKNEKIDKEIFETLVRRSKLISGNYNVTTLIYFP